MFLRGTELKTPNNMHTLTQKQIAGHLQVSEMAVVRLAQKQRIPYVMVGARRRFDPAVVDAYLVRTACAVLRRETR